MPLVNILFNTQVAYSVPLHCTLAPLSFASESALHWHTRHITHAMDLQNKNKLFFVFEKLELKCFNEARPKAL